jgi:hypothetical protein
MTLDQEKFHDDLRTWFSKNLAAPDRFDKNRNRRGPGQGLSWFKDSAQGHISKMREFAELLRSIDVVVDELTTERPGKILFEDEFQIVAKPFQDSGI